jgi:hypothetical protein
MKRGIRPVYDSFHMTMFHGIPMEIIEVAVKIQLIPDEMIPKPSLPDRFLAPFAARIGN